MTTSQCKSLYSLQNMPRKFKLEYDKWRLTINIDKTKYRYMGGLSEDTILNDRDKITTGMVHKNLGLRFNSKGTDKQEIGSRIVLCYCVPLIV